MTMRYIGIDVSKKTLAVAIPKAGKEGQFETKTYENSVKGIRELVKKLNPEEDHCVMEATGNYSILLLYMLGKCNIPASMVNPRQTHHFFLMKLEVTKTDKKDSILLSEYGSAMHPPIFKLPSETLMKLKQKRTVIKQLKKQRVALSNTLESISVLPVVDKSCQKTINETLAILDKKISKLENEMVSLTNEEFSELMRLLTSVKGIGAVLATTLIITTAGFTCFENSKQVSRYLGLCPTYQQSGTSLNQKGHISHSGDSYTRSLLYMGSLSAISSNTQCRECFLRLRKAGKPGKVAMVAVSNKLVRQAFAVVKSKVAYSCDHGVIQSDSNVKS